MSAPVGGGAPAVMDFRDGQTEVWLAPPAGAYNLRLEMLDNLDGARPLAEAATAREAIEIAGGLESRLQQVTILTQMAVILARVGDAT